MNVTKAVARVLTSRAVAPVFRPLVRHAVPVFMFHRFVDRDLGSDGLDPRVLRAQLEYLRRERFDLISLAAMTGETNGRGVRPGVAFTVDDGYTDFASVAAPVFAEFDCPVTVFIVTGAADDRSWLWWDRVAFAFAGTRRTGFELDLEGKRLSYRWSNAEERQRIEATFIEWLKTIPDGTKLEIIDKLSTLLDVEIPSLPPRKYQSMSWEEMRQFRQGGLVTFGPHTVTHPILPQTSDEQSAREITGAWQRLREMCDATVPVFCYPNGAYSAREVTTLGKTDMVGALTCEHRYASRSAFAAENPRRRFAVPRVTSHDEFPHFAQIVNGIERVKLRVRDGKTGWSTAGTQTSA